MFLIEPAKEVVGDSMELPKTVRPVATLLVEYFKPAMAFEGLMRGPRARGLEAVSSWWCASYAAK